MHSYLNLHRLKISVLLALSFTNILCYLLFFQSKPSVDYKLLDFIGEGGVLFCLITWLFFFLHIRPKGIVTNTIFIGLLLFYMASLQDFLDELFYVKNHSLAKFLESMPAIAGLMILTVGFYLWMKEQQSFNLSLVKKEKVFREHYDLDPITGLYNASYLEKTLQLEHRFTFMSFIDIDIDNFIDIDQHLNRANSKGLLRQTAKILEMSIPDSALICRYSRQRFVILFTHLDKASCQTITSAACQAIRATPFIHAEQSYHLSCQQHISPISDSNTQLRRCNKQFSQNIHTGSTHHQGECF